MDILEGNKIIARFDGWYQNDLINPGTDINWFHPVHSTRVYDKLQLPRSAAAFKYQTSWDWLMPVIIKIAQHRYVTYGDAPINFQYAWPRTFGMIDEDGRFMFRFNAAQLHAAVTLIDAAWLAVIDWLTFYNASEVILEPMNRAK